MSGQKLFAFTKDATIPISISLLIGLVVGVWALRSRVAEWERKLDRFETTLNIRMSDRWTYNMEREVWHEVAARNAGFFVPDLRKIREDDPIMDAR